MSDLRALPFDHHQAIGAILLGVLQPACAQACPTTAIVFGDLNDPNSRVARLAQSPRGTKLLEDLGAEPKITYLQKQPWHESDAQ